MADILVSLQNLDYVKKVEAPDMTEDYCIRFLSPSANAADGANGEDPYLRLIPKDPMEKGEYVEVSDRADLEDLIIELATGEAGEDYPEELTLETIGDCWVELVQDNIEITVVLGYDYVVEDKVNEEAGITGDKAIVLNLPGETAAPEGEATETADTSNEEVIE